MVAQKIYLVIFACVLIKGEFGPTKAWNIKMNEWSNEIFGHIIWGSQGELSSPIAAYTWFGRMIDRFQYIQANSQHSNVSITRNLCITLKRTIQLNYLNILLFKIKFWVSFWRIYYNKASHYYFVLYSKTNEFFWLRMKYQLIFHFSFIVNSGSTGMLRKLRLIVC